MTRQSTPERWREQWGRVRRFHSRVRYLASETEISGDLAKAWVGDRRLVLWRGGDPVSPTGGWEALGTVGVRMH